LAALKKLSETKAAHTSNGQRRWIGLKEFRCNMFDTSERRIWGYLQHLGLFVG
jgi:hypothetical protein